MIMVPDSEQVFYKMSELSEMLGVETSVLRFWEKEFAQIKPMKVSQRKRLYRRKDFELFREIKRLLYDERFTIAGAKKRLESSDPKQGLLFDEQSIDNINPAAGPDYTAVFEELKAARQTIEEVRRDLLDLKNLISRSLPFPAYAHSAGGRPGEFDESGRAAFQLQADSPVATGDEKTLNLNDEGGDEADGLIGSSKTFDD